MFVVVSYDISDDRRRTKVMKTLRNYGAHVQYSVFECNLKREDYRRLREKLAELIDKKEDNLRFYVLSKEDVRKRRVWGSERTEVVVKPWYVISGGDREGEGG